MFNPLRVIYMGFGLLWVIFVQLTRWVKIHQPNIHRFDSALGLFAPPTSSDGLFNFNQLVGYEMFNPLWDIHMGLGLPWVIFVQLMCWVKIHQPNIHQFDSALGLFAPPTSSIQYCTSWTGLWRSSQERLCHSYFLGQSHHPGAEKPLEIFVKFNVFVITEQYVVEKSLAL